MGITGVARLNAIKLALNENVPKAEVTEQDAEMCAYPHNEETWAVSAVVVTEDNKEGVVPVAGPEAETDIEEDVVRGVLTNSQGEVVMDYAEAMDPIVNAASAALKANASMPIIKPVFKSDHDLDCCRIPTSTRSSKGTPQIYGACA